jgi:hypothetical protein
MRMALRTQEGPKAVRAAADPRAKVSELTVPPSNKPAGITNRHFLRVQAPHAGLFARTALLAVLAIGGAVWALVRHYTYSPPPLRVPRPPTTHESDDPSTLQAPELLGREDAG